MTTKYGIPPARNRGLLSLGRRAAGPILQMFPAVKRRLAGAANRVSRPVESKADFTAAQAEASLHQSLRELQTDRIDVWLLHEAEANDLNDDGLLRLLRDAVAQGKVGTFGVGSCRDKIPQLLAERPEYCPVLQFEWSVFDPPVGATAAFTMHHRALTANFSAMHTNLRNHPVVCSRWSEEVGADLARPETLAALMLKAALVANPSSIILVSSRDPKHISENARVAEDAALSESAWRLYAIIQREGLPSSSHPTRAGLRSDFGGMR